MESRRCSKHGLKERDVPSLKHVHKDSWERYWLSLPNGILNPHPFCDNCGVVKNVSDDKARRLGYFIQVLSEIKQYFRRKRYKVLTGVQMRLIIKKLQDTEGFEDAYWMRYSKQKSIFLETVCSYTSFSRSLVEGFL
jgi:hypothetical protein